MTESEIRFDAAAYDHAMAPWSRLVGNRFLDWLAPHSDLRWIDIGCGTGAFTEILVERCKPAEIRAIDPSGSQLALARARLAAPSVQFSQGDAIALAFPGDRFDAATMALVIFYVAEPSKGVAEMVRVVRPGGIVAAYVWDVLGGGSPTYPILNEIRSMGITPLSPPSVDASRMETLKALWMDARLDKIETLEITASRSFINFDDYWTTNLKQPTIGPSLATMTASDVELLKARVRDRLHADAAGRITYVARANAIKGQVPA